MEQEKDKAPLRVESCNGLFPGMYGGASQDSKKRPKEKDLKANGAHKAECLCVFLSFFLLIIHLRLTGLEAAPEPVKKKPTMSAPDTAKSEKEQNDVKTGSKEAGQAGV